MSEPTRYTAVGSGVVRTDPNGLLIAYGHYVELKAEVERLTNKNAFLKLEVERLKNNCEYIDSKLDEYIDGKESD